MRIISPSIHVPEQSYFPAKERPVFYLFYIFIPPSRARETIELTPGSTVPTGPLPACFTSFCSNNPEYNSSNYIYLFLFHYILRTMFYFKPSNIIPYYCKPQSFVFVFLPAYRSSTYACRVSKRRSEKALYYY